MSINSNPQRPSRRMGEMLSTLVPLSNHDIDEILCEQIATRRRFGDIALSLGLCRPEHVWEAWLAQLASTPSLVIDLNRSGPDAQAASLCNAEVAERLHVIPLRAFEGIVLVAISVDTSEAERQSAARELSNHLRREVRLVGADRSQIRNAIRTYYVE